MYLRLNISFFWGGGGGGGGGVVTGIEHIIIVSIFDEIDKGARNLVPRACDPSGLRQESRPPG